jgi:hypothetical protein
MLTIRPAQIEALHAAAMQAFEDRTYRHLQEYFPIHCTLLGEASTRLVIRLGWQKAKSYDLTAECCVRSYVDLMCLLGSGFDADPLLPWAARILNYKVICGEVERGDLLYDQAWEYIDYIAQDYRDPTGQPTTARFVDEIRSLRHGCGDVVNTDSYRRFAGDLANRLKSVFPAKCQYVGDQRLENFVDRSFRSAQTYGISTERGITLFAALMFVLGNGFADDPLLPWARVTLNDTGIASEEERIDRLYSSSVGFLRRWWDTAPPEEG